MALPSSESLSCTFSTDSPEFLTDESLHEAYELELKTKDGESVRFGELVAGKGDTITTIVIFGNAKPAQVIIIGCGDHSVIVPYTEETTDAFPIYSDASGKIYEQLHMKRTLEGFTTPPPYAPESFTSALAKYVKQTTKNLIAGLKGGPLDQQGGEWIFHRGKLRFSHRMEAVNDHLSAERLLDILRTDQGQDSPSPGTSQDQESGYS
ncbi:hypothetical protein N7510_010331 [Penicillium lagena]|uniref:uncharacterized protein n=1 Tax=Penicillium lagena TaxID=94218 RepID=UPI00254199AC|nr:uncharacterized protein N7510_010331 [Penicillium lagena]KAJ5605177.1 hypothetical protein N7510_010331 [Penicillium lagena]